MNYSPAPHSHEAPAPGELWALSHEDTPLGTVLLGCVTDSYVSALPVTTDASLACLRSTVVPAVLSPIGAELVIWSALPNSFDLSLLDRRIGVLCTQDEVLAMTRAVEDGSGEVPYPLAPAGLPTGRTADVERLAGYFAAVADLS